jgi:hypothetical protein
MEYSKLVAISGLPGLFEVLNSKTDGAVVRSVDDKSTRFVSTRIHQFTQLENIEIYTQRENVNLVDVFQAMDKAGGSLPDEKDNAAIKKYFEKTYPDMDFERVYASDMKKMIKWFDILKKNNIEIKLTEIPEEEPEEIIPAPPVKEEKKPEKKVKPAAEIKEPKEEKAAKPAAKPSSPATAKKKSDKKEETTKKSASKDGAKAAPKKKK